MEGDGTKANPDKPVTRQETMVLLCRALNIAPVDNVDLSAYSDAGAVAGWAAPYVAAITEAGIVKGVGNGLLDPNGEMTRASFLAVLDRAVTQYVNKPGTYDLADEGLILVAAGDVTLTGKTTADILVTSAAAGKKLIFDKAEVEGSVTVPASISSVTGKNHSFVPQIVAVRKERTDSDDPGQEILRAMSYCGDVAACQMTADQALAYAQLLADGIQGKVPYAGNNENASIFSEWYNTLEADKFFWEEPNTAWGYSGEYQTDRANVILGDFAGDGTPYLCVVRSIAPEEGFDIYYSDGAAARYVFGGETYMGRDTTSFTLDKDGAMTVSNAGIGGAGLHGNDDYIVSGGKAVKVYSYEENFDYDTELMHVTINGMETIYTQEEWEQENYNAGKKLNSDAKDQEYVISAAYTPIPLHTMIDYLNRYAAAKGSTRSVTTEKRSDRSRMAEAMLNVIDEWPKEESDEALLVDLDGDGWKELLIYRGGIAYLYHWKDGQLHEEAVDYDFNGVNAAWWLCKDSSTGELGIAWNNYGGGNNDVDPDDAGRYTSVHFNYLTHTIGIEIREYKGETHYYFVDYVDYNYSPVEISQEEYQRIYDQNQQIENLNIGWAIKSTRWEETVAELKDLL